MDRFCFTDGEAIHAKGRDGGGGVPPRGVAGELVAVLSGIAGLISVPLAAG